MAVLILCVAVVCRGGGLCGVDEWVVFCIDRVCECIVMMRYCGFVYVNIMQEGVCWIVFFVCMEGIKCEALYFHRFDITLSTVHFMTSSQTSIEISRIRQSIE